MDFIVEMKGSEMPDLSATEGKRSSYIGVSERLGYPVSGREKLHSMSWYLHQITGV
jgi:hypothetical protein